MCPDSLILHRGKYHEFSMLPDEIPPRGVFVLRYQTKCQGFILPEKRVLAGSWFHWWHIIAGGTIQFSDFCRDETPSEPRFARECARRPWQDRPGSHCTVTGWARPGTCSESSYWR